MNASGDGLLACFFSVAIGWLVFGGLGFLLLLAFLLFALDLGALLVVALALIGKLFVLDGDLLLPSCSVTASTSAATLLATLFKNRISDFDAPELHVDLATFLLLGIGEHRMMVLHQCGLHVVITFEFDEATAHGLAGVLVGAKADLERLEFGEMFFDLLLGRAEGQIAYDLVSTGSKTMGRREVT